MRILYVHQYFKTPVEGGAIRSWYIARAMVEKGMLVELITSHNGTTLSTTVIDGINVHYLPVKYDNSFSLLRRLWAFLWFSHRAWHYAKKLGKFDLAFFTSTPLTVGLTALKLNRRYSLPYVFEVRDLWPEVPISLGLLRPGIIGNLARRLEENIYNKSSGLIALSPGIFNYLKKRQPEKPVYFCPNMSDCDFFINNDPPDRDIIHRYAIKNEFIISYFGALGKLNNIEYLLEVAEKALHKKWNIRFMIIGRGGQKSILEKMAVRKNLTNVVFVPHLSKYDLRRYLSVTNAAFVSFAPYHVLEFNSPNKFFDGLASGKMIILNVGGWLRELVEKYNAGVFVNPEDPEDFLAKIVPYLLRGKEYVQACQNARKLAEVEFSRNKLTDKLIEFIGKIN